MRSDVMRTSIRISRAGWVAAIALLMSLSGCGGSSAGTASSGTPKKNASHAQQKPDPGVRETADMVAAVSAGKAGPPVQMKFELRDLPQAGQPVDVDIAIIPDAPSINRLYAKFQGGDALAVVQGGELSQVDKPAAGSAIRHVLRVIPKQDGIFALSATVSVDLADDSLTRTFSIPVIVGEGLPESPAKAEVADGQAASGTVAKTH